MKKMIKNDLFDIASRLAEIDAGYFVLFDTESLRYELHNSRFNPSLQLIFPFEKLDARSIEHTLKTRTERREALIAELDRDNEKLMREREEEIKNKAACTAERLTSYYLRKPDKIGEKIENI